jgi:hypothetical protein
VLASVSALAALLLVVQAAAADEPSPAPGAGLEADADGGGTDDEGSEDDPDDPLSRYRTPFGVLVERTIGTSSRPVEFNWRRTTVQIAATGNHLFELNNFNSLRAGGLARFPVGGGIFELGLSHVWVWDTPSSELLAYTPYRQPGRPKRLELDLTIGYPLAEGVVTVAPRFFPAVELVFNAYAGLRYLFYPGTFEGMRPREVAGALASPFLTETEIEQLDDRRLDAMQVDSGRYGLMVGVGDDIYFRQGVFVAPRLMMAVPVLQPASQTELLFWADLSLTVGVAF